eukprot:2950992-Pleurochrysis_carterae.AAC.1
MGSGNGQAQRQTDSPDSCHFFGGGHEGNKSWRVEEAFAVGNVVHGKNIALVDVAIQDVGGVRHHVLLRCVGKALLAEKRN